MYTVAESTKPGIPGGRLSRQRILDAALSLVESDGLEALSMRRLAEALDVWPMSLYRHFQDKEDLVAAVADAAVGRIVTPTQQAPWTEQMRQLLTQAKGIFERHPGTLRPGDDGQPAAARVHTAGLAILKRAGVNGDDCDSAWQALLAYTAGAAALSSTPEEFEFGLGRLLDGLSQ